MAITGHGILVGYDGSAGSQQGLRWATRAARERGVVLTICHAWTQGYAGPSAAAELDDPTRQDAERILASGLRSTQHASRSQDVRPLLAEGPAARTLCGNSSGADIVVVGSRGAGGFPGLLLGSVSLQVAAYAPGPVVVVCGHWRPAGAYAPGPVVVGADGSAASDAALAFAGVEAALRGAPLVAVCALADAPGDLGAAHHIEEGFERSLTSWEKEHPEVAVLRQVSVRSPRAALLTAAEDAQLLVVGRRGRGGIQGMILGSVSQALLWHAPCPVAVVHPR
jgi:nucleotide-binding universal stress UspA family protein